MLIKLCLNLVHLISFMQVKGCKVHIWLSCLHFLFSAAQQMALLLVLKRIKTLDMDVFPPEERLVFYALIKFSVGRTVLSRGSQVTSPALVRHQDLQQIKEACDECEQKQYGWSPFTSIKHISAPQFKHLKVFSVTYTSNTGNPPFISGLKALNKWFITQHIRIF